MPRFPIDRLTIVGAGTMGSGIAIAALRGGARVTLTDAYPKSIERVSLGQSLIEAGLKRAGLPEAQDRLSITATVEDACAESSFILEAIPEKIDLKREFFRHIDGVAPSDCLFVSNTSTFTIKEIASVCSATRRRLFGGMHFFSRTSISNTADTQPVVEVVKAAELDPDAYDAMVRMGRETMGKTVLPTSDVPGFALNRIIVPAMMEMYQILEREDITPRQLDEALELIGWPTLARFGDIVGNDVYWDLLQSGKKRTGVDLIPETWKMDSPFLERLIKGGAFGKKVGKGIFEWDGDMIKGDAQSANEA